MCPELMHGEWRRSISRAYFDQELLTSHHLRSFNQFISHGLQAVVDQTGVIETEIEASDSDASLRIELGNIRVESPTVTETDGQEREIHPQEARLRDLTYAAPLHVEMRIVVTSDEERVLEDGEYKIGRLPIMVKSAKCNLHGQTAKVQTEHGEDPVDPGGYFIINGSERVLTVYEDLIHNRIITEYEDSNQETPVAKVISQSNGKRSITTVEFDSEQDLSVNFPVVPKTLDFPLLLRALGLKTDKTISTYFHADNYDEELMKFLWAQLDDAEISDPDTAVREIGRIIAPNPGYDDDYRKRRAKQTISNHLLPHLSGKTRVDSQELKADYLCRMAEACFELELGRRDPDDKDHYAHKRLKTTGELMTDLFRASLNRLCRDIKYQVKKTHQRNRSIKIATVLQPELITSRLEQALATGQWVRGRSGVAQLVSRTNQMSLLTQLRRVASPLSRSQPHFEARALHCTEWGRLCPSETPEGQNCGLVKHLAQSVSVADGLLDEEEIREALVEMGVEPQ